MTRTTKRILKAVGIIIMVPLLTVCAIVGLAYYPPVQKWLINTVGEHLEESLGMRVHVDDVRITPFLDLVAEGVTAIDTEGDTLLATRQLTFDVALRPLFEGRADVSGFNLRDSKVYTKSLISDCCVRGTVGTLAAELHGVEWTPELVRLTEATLADAALSVTLTDTAAQDTASHLKWIIDVDRANIRNTRLDVKLPPDSTGHAMQADAAIGRATMEGGHFDLGRPHYAFRRLDLLDSRARVDSLVDVSHLSAIIDTLSYDSHGALRCGVRGLSFDEKRYDLHVREISGGVYADSSRLELPSLSFRSLFSRLDADVALDWAALKSGDVGSMRFNVDGAIGREDIENLLATAVRERYVDRSLLDNDVLKPFLRSDIHLRASGSGNMSHLTVDHYTISMPQLLSAQGDLVVSDDLNAYSGHVSGNVYGGNVKGRFATNLRRETYDVSADLQHFPLSRFVKDMPLTPFTGHVAARGRGFDPTAPGASVDATIGIDRFTIAGYDLSGLAGDATLAGGKARANVAYANAMGRARGNVTADLRHGYDATAHLTLDDLDLHLLAGAPDSMLLHTVVDMHATATKDMRRITAEGSITENRLSTPQRSVEMKDVGFAFATSPRDTKASVTAGDMDMTLFAQGDIDHIMAQASAFVETLQRQIDSKAIDQEALRRAMPTTQIALHAGTDNPLYNYLNFQGAKLSSVDLDLTTNSTDGINGVAAIGTVNVGSLQLDTIYADIAQEADGIKLRSTVRNYRRDNPNRFTANIDAGLMARGCEAAFNFKDEKGRTGIDLGVRAETENGTARFTLYPHNPIIAFRSFAINDDNFISINRQGMMRADVHLVADDGTGLIVYSEPTDETVNDITLSIYNLNLGELCDALPYFPSMAGMVNGDFHVIDEHTDTRTLSAMGSVSAADFAYDGTVIGDLGAEIIYLPKENGEHYADAFISYNGDEVGEASGIYNDQDGHFNGDVNLADFPLSMVNSFLEGTDFMMRGNANGQFAVHGTLDRPVLDGTLNFDDAHFYSPVYGVDFKMEERPLAIDGSRLQFDDFRLTSGETDLRVDGSVDMTDLSRICIDFSMKANDFELINTPRQATSLVYGKVMADFNGTARGPIDNLVVRGQLNVLPTTDATYLLTNSPLTVEDRLADLVTFMDFNDTTTVALPAEESEMRYDVTLGINVGEGSRFHCFLSANGSSYVDLQGGGNLTLRMTQEGDMRLIGRYTIQEGKMNYELPVIPLKTFTLKQGSSVEFSGDMMNPRLAITATEETKAVVVEDERQRNVNFVVGVDISRTLQDMGLAFTIDAPEDLGVQNLLAAMSEEDRYKTAVALLATGMYVTENLTTLKASNALNAFLQNEIQNIAGKALSTFDLSFGMEGGTSAKGTATTDYSFRFSKRFLDDRISINVGGRVSTGQDATNNAASFIDNISLEYRLDNSGTRYVRVFYDRDSHDPLEGSMMKTGAGLVLRRKTDRLGDLFLFRRKD